MPPSDPLPLREPPLVELRLPLARLVRLLAGCAILVGLAGAGAHYARVEWPALYGHVRYLDVHEPLGLESWFNAVLAFVVALAMFLVARIERGLGGRFVLHWRLLGLVFLGVSLASVVPLQPWLETVITGLVETPPALPGPFYQLQVGALVLLGLLYLPLLWHVPPRISTRLVLGAALLGLSAPLLEPWQGHYADATRGGMSLSWGLVSTLEETLELLGLVVFLSAALLHVRERVALRLVLRLSRRARRMRIRTRLPEGRPVESEAEEAERPQVGALP